MSNKIGANDIREGNVIKFDGKLCLVRSVNHVKPGKGGAFVKLEMKDCIKNISVEGRLESSVWVEKPMVEEHECPYLYFDGKLVAVMGLEYEPIELDISMFGKEGKLAAYLREGMQVTVAFCESLVLYVKIPDTVECEVSETEAVIKGQTATSSYKPALLTNGIKISVPPFVKVGDKILVKTAEGEYHKRA